MRNNLIDRVRRLQESHDRLARLVGSLEFEGGGESDSEDVSIALEFALALVVDKDVVQNLEEVLTPLGQIVQREHGCPCCGNRRIDFLTCLDGKIRCESCEHSYSIT